MKLRNILAAVMVAVIVLTLAGCNYVGRPSGGANHGSDLSGKLLDLLVKTDYEYEEPNVKDELYYDGPAINTGDSNEDDKPQEPDDPTPPPVEKDPDPVLTPFTSTYDPTMLLTKIAVLVVAVQLYHDIGNSATGVSDELLSGRTVKILVPDDFPVNDESVEALTAQYNCSVILKRVGTGSAYTAACRRAALSGDAADLMYVDNSIWGDVHTFTQVVDPYVNLEMGDALDTYSSVFTKKFLINDSFEKGVVRHYVAAGMGAPYLLAYNKANVNSATLAESSYVGEDGLVTLRAIEGKDPVEMYENRTWGLNVFTEMLKASTSGTNVGIASEIDALEGLDIWYGMENAGGISIVSHTTEAEFSLAKEASTGINTIQNWYWNTTGADAQHYVGNLENASAWTDGTVYQKLFNRYTGEDAVKSYSFVACNVEDLVDISAAAKTAGADWDFVAYPYGETYEKTNRAYSAIDFSDKVNADNEGVLDESYVKQIETPVAGWCGGFAVLKSCENPSIALRVGEEIVKIWKETYEDPALEAMTTEQLNRYYDMKDNMAVSFVRAWAEKAADINEVYPNVTKYFYGANDKDDADIPTTGYDPDAYTTDFARLLALPKFDGNANLVVHPMYHKNEASGLYNPLLQKTWSDWAEGTTSDVYETAEDSLGVMNILNSSLLPNTVMFGA